MSGVYDAHAKTLPSPLAPFQVVWARISLLGPRFLFGLRLAASVCLALYVTYFLELQNSFWAATTAAIVCQPSLGASLQKARYRVVGTIVGALVMVALFAMFPQQRNSLLLGLALWCGICGFAVVMLRNFASYAAALSGVTATIIFVDALNDPNSAFFLAVIRASEICIGIMAAGFVFMLTDFGAASRQLKQTLSLTADQLAKSFVGTLALRKETPELQASRRSAVRALGPLNVQIDAAIGESAYLRSRNGNLRCMLDALVSALVAWHNLSNHIVRRPDDESPVSRTVVPLLQSIDLSQINHSPEAAQRRCREVVTQIRSIPTFDATGCLVVDASRDVALAVSGLVDGVVLLDRRKSERIAARAQPLILTDLLPAVLNGLRVFLAVLGTAIFWVASAWPNGSFAIVFAAAATLIFGSFGDLARPLSRDYAIGAGVMVAVGSVLYFAVLPSISSFPALIVVLGTLFFVIGTMQAGPWHSVMFLAMSVVSLPILGVANPISYSAAAYFNLALAVLIGTIIGSLFFVLMPVIPPGTRARRLLALSLRDFRRLSLGKRAADERRWTALMSRRIEALPSQTTPEEAGSLMALLALGQAVIHLRSTLSGPSQALLSSGLDALAGGRLDAARESLDALLHSPMPGRAQVGHPARVRAAVAVILDAIELNAVLLTAKVETRQLFLLSFR